MLESLFSLENKMESFYKSYSQSTEVILFGAGFALDKMLKKLSEKGLNIVCICDNDPQKQGTLINSKLPVYSFNQCEEKYPKALYVITSHMYFWDIKKELESKISEKRVCDLDFECSHYFDGFELRNFIFANKQQTKEVLASLSDQYSKEIFLNVLKAHFTGERANFDRAFSGNDDWYLFESLLKPSANCVYLDCGAYDGDTLMLFERAASDGYAELIAMEPDVEVRERLLATIERLSNPNATLIEKGAYDREGEIEFVQEGVYSSISGNSENTNSNVSIGVTKIDTVLSGKKIDLIKMDIEGAEYNALLGAKETIKSNRPNMAICLYHRFDDFLRIPLLIKSWSLDYKFYIRHQSTGCTDTILFAVQEGRSKKSVC